MGKVALEREERKKRKKQFGRSSVPGSIDVAESASLLYF